MKTLSVRCALVALGLGALFALLPTTQKSKPSAIVPGGPVQVISLVGTTQPEPKKAVPLVTSRHSAVVDIVAGDKGIHQKELQRVAQVIQQDSSRTLRSTVGFLPSMQTEVVLYSAPTGYERAAQTAFATSQVTIVVQQTGGFTVGSKVYLPLYKYKDTAFLANTLTHELTHATFNELGASRKLPTWLNEGLAWYDGTQAEQAINRQAVQKMETALMSQLKMAQQAGQLQPLSASGANVLRQNPPYNTEFQDYLAVKDLIQVYGRPRVHQFLLDLKRTSLQASFQEVYDISIQSFLKSYTGNVEMNYAIRKD